MVQKTSGTRGPLNSVSEASSLLAQVEFFQERGLKKLEINLNFYSLSGACFFHHQNDQCFTSDSSRKTELIIIAIILYVSFLEICTFIKD